MRRDVVRAILGISARIPVIDIDVAVIGGQTGAAPRGKRVKIDVVGVTRNRYRAVLRSDIAAGIVGVVYIPVIDINVAVIGGQIGSIV